MNSYEGVFVLRPDLTKELLDQALNQIKDVIGKHKGSIGEIKEWGKQKLAYPIKRYKEGVYYLVNFHIDPEVIVKIKRSFGLNESILREMIVKRKA